MMMQSPFGRPLFDRLGLNPAAFAAAAGPTSNAPPMRADQSLEAQIAAANNTAPTPSYLIPQRVDMSSRAAGLSPPEGFAPQMQISSRALPLPEGYDPNVNQPSIGDFDGRFAQAAAQSANRNPLAGLQGIQLAAMQAINNQLPQGSPPFPSPLTGAPRPPFLTNSVVLPESGFSTVGPGSAPANVQPINSGGGISNIAFPTLAPSNTNTFTGGLFGGNNPMNNSPMNGGGMNSNQPLSQQIPQAVQQAVTPLLQSTASQLNQGIGSMVNERLVGGGGGQARFGGGSLPGFYEEVNLLQPVFR